MTGDILCSTYEIWYSVKSERYIESQQLRGSLTGLCVYTVWCWSVIRNRTKRGQELQGNSERANIFSHRRLFNARLLQTTYLLVCVYQRVSLTFALDVAAQKTHSGRYGLRPTLLSHIHMRRTGSIIHTRCDTRVFCHYAGTCFFFLVGGRVFLSRWRYLLYCYDLKKNRKKRNDDVCFRSISVESLSI